MTQEQQIAQNAKESKEALKGLKSLLWDTPKAILQPIITGTTRSMINQLPYGIETIQALVDDKDMLDIAKPIAGSANQFRKDLKKTVEGIKNEFRKMKEQTEREERNKMSKPNNKNNKSTTRNDNTRTNNTKDTNTRNESTRKNHPSWYLQDNTMVSELVGINISNRQNVIDERIGIAFSSSTTPSNGNEKPYSLASIPSVVGVEMALVIPKTKSNDWQQSINNLYRNVRAANSGAINYSPGQLASYVLSIRSIDALLAVLQRAVSALNSGTFYDALSPQIYFAAMGLDYDTFADNAANVRELYNRLSAIRYRNMPLNITLLDRTRWLFSNVFKDSNDIKSQLYVPYFDKVYMYTTDRNGDNYVSVIDIFDDVAEDRTGKTFSDFSSAILNAFNIFQSDDIFQLIAGDIIKAYGKDALTKYPDIPQNSELKPEYDEYILMQIQNASIAMTGNLNVEHTLGEDFVDNTITEVIYPDSEFVGNKLLNPINPRSIEQLNRYMETPFYNSNVNKLDAGRLLSTTRLMTICHGVNGTDFGTVEYDTYGTEIVERLRVVLKYKTSDNKYNIQSSSIGRVVAVSYADSSQNTPNSRIPFWSWFDYFPLIITVYKFLQANNEVLYQYGYPLFDFNNFGLVYRDNLESYNAICTLSMLHKPFVARVNRTEVLEA